MKNTFILAFALLASSFILGQEKSKEKPQNTPKLDTTKVYTIDNMIKTLYGSISGEKGKARNWKQFKYLFHKDAKLIPSGENREGDFKIRYMSPDDYIKSSGKWLVQNGFIEKEIHREIQQFGNLVHVFSTYESYKSAADEKPFMRGINSIQLLFDNNRWWIVNIYWTNESRYNPIPKAYLPKLGVKNE
ncbi:hypothetical protein [Seonamhaeicola marinus]|uniref:Nuclear transport factor 2 family protein n=1 Tax=Seonamhaeicola marinus TaxID=1912246 RepID=A0A5D0HK08_9FLAO|nr:hypothetical protein [Seonamhaeicola marinus]TYA71585.1 hypothetical protein FUA24_18585 [Seonamhaeicola marinus]